MCLVNKILRLIVVGLPEGNVDHAVVSKVGEQSIKIGFMTTVLSGRRSEASSLFTIVAHEG